MQWNCFFSFNCLFFFFFLGPHLWHMKVPRLGVKSELQLPAYAEATATQDPSHICDPHRRSRQRRILNPLSEARHQTRVLTDTSQIHYHWAMMGTPGNYILINSLEDSGAGVPWHGRSSYLLPGTSYSSLLAKAGLMEIPSCSSPFLLAPGDGLLREPPWWWVWAHVSLWS